MFYYNYKISKSYNLFEIVKISKIILKNLNLTLLKYFSYNLLMIVFFKLKFYFCIKYIN